MASYQHTYEENILLIQKDAIAGKDVRLAIAEAIEQAYSESTGSIINRINGLTNLLTIIQNLVNNRELFVNINHLEKNDYEMEIINAL